LPSKSAPAALSAHSRRCLHDSAEREVVVGNAPRLREVSFSPSQQGQIRPKIVLSPATGRDAKRPKRLASASVVCVHVRGSSSLGRNVSAWVTVVASSSEACRFEEKRVRQATFSIGSDVWPGERSLRRCWISTTSVIWCSLLVRRISSAVPEGCSRKSNIRTNLPQISTRTRARAKRSFLAFGSYRDTPW